jgi:uncharacterized protein YndB with AHSA1/START domain
MTNETTITAQPGEPIIDIFREVDAPIADVYRAYTDPVLIAQWLGPRGYDLDVREYDIRDGGGYRYIHSNPEGMKFGFRGVFHSVKPEERIIQTFEFDGAPGHVSLESIVFEPAGEKTRLRLHSVYGSIGDRDAIIENGMAMGVTQGFERLDELLVRS